MQHFESLKKVVVLPCFVLKITHRIANSADPDQTAPKEQSDHNLHCLFRHFRTILKGNDGPRQGIRLPLIGLPDKNQS